MAIYKKFFSVIMVSAVGGFFPFLASLYFDSTLSHGIISADILFLVLLLALPNGHVLWKIPFVVSSCIFAVVSNSLDAYATSGVLIAVVITTTLIPRNRISQFLLFVVISVLFLLADWANFFYSTFVLTLPDIWGLAKFFWWGPILFIAIPFLQILLELFFVRKILWEGESLEISHWSAYAIVIVVLGLNFGISALQQKIPFLDFSVKKWMWQICTPGVIGQNPYLQEDIKAAFSVWKKEKTVMTDFEKPTVDVLVESYGVNKSIAYTDSLLAPFANTNASFVGLFSRDAAHTQGAEWEDFGAPQGVVKQKTIPQQFKENGLQTWFLHGYRGDFYNREDNYKRFGFDSLLFKNDFDKRNFENCHYGYKGICDSAIVRFIDSLLADSLPKFIYWTTLDAHPPYEFADTLERSSVCKSLNLSNVDCTYFTLQQNTVRRLVRLAVKHPNYRFVIRGDHRPMGSLEQSNFVQSFYFRWVPLIIINDT